MSLDHTEITSDVAYEQGLCHQPAETVIRAKPYHSCVVCGAQGSPLYERVRDRISDVPGEWTYKRCSNRDCGVAWLDPMPLREDIGRAYQRYFTHDQSNLPPRRSLLRRVYEALRSSYLSSHFGYKSSRRVLDPFLALAVRLLPTRASYIDFGIMHLEYKPQGKLLDIGCGAGGVMMSLRHLGWTVEGIDFDPVVAEKARSKGLNVRCGTLEEQCYPDGAFDAIIMSHVIEHVHQPLEILVECERILSPGGRLVILTPNIQSLGQRHFKGAWLYLDPPRHLHLFSKSALAELARKAGFRTAKSMTSARTAGRMYIGSRDIRATGHHDANGSMSFGVRLGMELLELAEWFYTKVDDCAGEELVFVATKDAGPVAGVRDLAKAT